MPDFVQISSFADEQAIVSPCSTCKKYSANSDPNYPICPRYMWKKQKEEYEAGRRDYPINDFLVESGTEDKEVLSNPVYSKSTNSILVWVAKLSNNKPYIKDNQQLNGNILEPGFDTNYIQCEQLPFIPAEAMQSMWSRGAYKENDTLVITSNPHPQIDSENPTKPESVAGFCRKINFHRSFSLSTPTWDKIVSGT